MKLEQKNRINNIKYIAFYDVPLNQNENRYFSLSATNKIDYICSALNKINYIVEIVSPSWTNNLYGFYKGKVKKITTGINLKTFHTFGGKHKIHRYMKYLFSLFQLFLYLLINIKKNETVIVYHSVILSLPLTLLKYLKKFKLILEVEEIYQDIQNYKSFFKKNEYNIFKFADGYIFSTKLLNEKINFNNKPYIVIHGTYKVEKDLEVKFNNNKIHVVYAGTFEPKKGGAIAAAAAAHLPKNYHIHIIGFGSKEQIKNIETMVKNINKLSKATVTYDGLLTGIDYTLFLQKCQIGLSTQNPDAEFNETSFPSKILSYMANGLRVVSVRIDAIEKSKISNSLIYYDEQKPENIAEAIRKIDLKKPCDSRKVISELNKKFILDLNKILNG